MDSQVFKEKKGQNKDEAVCNNYYGEYGAVKIGYKDEIENNPRDYFSEEPDVKKRDIP